MNHSNFDTVGNRAVVDFSYILKSIPLGYDEGELKSAYSELCNYLKQLIDFDYGDKVKIIEYLISIASRDGGYIGNSYIQKMFGIDYKKKIVDQVDDLTVSGIPSFLQALKDGKKIRMLQKFED